MLIKLKKWYKRNVQTITVFGVFVGVLFFLYLAFVFILAETMKILGYEL